MERPHLERIRLLSYPATNVFLVLFSVDDPKSLDAVRTRVLYGACFFPLVVCFFPRLLSFIFFFNRTYILHLFQLVSEIESRCPGTPWILVATKTGTVYFAIKPLLMHVLVRVRVHAHVRARVRVRVRVRVLVRVRVRVLVRVFVCACACACGWKIYTQPSFLTVLLSLRGACM